MEIVRLPKVSRRHIRSEAQQQKTPSLLPPAGPGRMMGQPDRSHLRLVAGGEDNSKQLEGVDAAPVSASIQAPDRLVADTRAAFRKDAMSYLDRAAAQQVKEFGLDMSRTVEMDASGLGILVVVQKKASELGIQMKIVKAPQQVRYLLLLTKLEHLFMFVD
jgi:anti-anti-sigma factor